MPAESPVVSVILPTYNRSGRVQGAIRSVLEQSFENFEILVVDDGSTDGTEDVVQRCMSADRRIRYLKLDENRGVAFARDIGLRAVRGEYIAWIDSDDRWLPTKLHEQMRVMWAYPEIEILFADFINHNQIKGIRERAFVQSAASMEMLQVVSPEQGLKVVAGGIEKALLRDVFIQLQSAIWRSSLVEKVGGFEIGLRSSEDFEFFWRSALLGARFGYQEESFVERIKSADSLTANSEQAWKHKIEALQRCRMWAEKLGRTDLLIELDRAEERAIRNLMRALAMNGDRRGAVRLLFSKRARRVSLRTLAAAVAALAGPPAFAVLDRIASKFGKRRN